MSSLHIPLPPSVARCLMDGIIEINVDTLELTEKGAQVVAEAAGWARGEDDDGDECFVDTGSYNMCSYVEDWRALVRAQGLAELSVPIAKVLAR